MTIRPNDCPTCKQDMLAAAPSEGGRGEEMSATNRGIRKFKEWMRVVQESGWSRNTWSALADLWWQYHNDDGDLKP